MNADDVNYALGRFVDLCTIAAGGGFDDSDPLEVASRVYEGAGFNLDALSTLIVGLHELAARDAVAHLDLTDDITVGAVGFGALLGATAMEHSMESRVRQLRAALELIAEPDPGDEMFGRASAEKRIARVALDEVD